jgi:hypothetical protein
MQRGRNLAFHISDLVLLAFHISLAERSAAENSRNTKHQQRRRFIDCPKLIAHHSFIITTNLLVRFTIY